MMKLTKPQKLIYDMEKYAGGTISVICGSMLINGIKELSELMSAVHEIYRMNDALRIRISESEGNVYQSIIEYVEQDIEVLYFKNKTELDNFGENFARKPIDMQGNLCEMKIVILPDKYGLLVKLHHMVGDAWTLVLIGTQFNKLIKGDKVESYSYTNYIDKEDEYFKSTRYKNDKEFFLDQFKKCDEVTYIKEKQSDKLKGCRKTFVIDVDRTKQIQEFAHDKGVSPFVMFTAILAVYMNRIKMNAEKFYIGTAVLNRNGRKEKNTMGMFVNTAPMLIELDNTKDFVENLSKIKNAAYSALRHQKFNYGDVLTAIRKEYSFTEKLYDVLISYQNATIAGAECETTWYYSGEQTENLEIHIDDRDNEGIFRIHYDYMIDKFSENEINLLHQHIENLLFDAIENEDKKPYELEMLTADEKNKLLYDFNDTATDYPKDKCVHELFEEQVERTPDKIAVIACDKTLTYKELNEEANRIAHSLIDKGIRVGDIVAFALPRKSYLIATIFGILKSGAAYLPIDPDYPQDRIDYMLSDSNAKLFVTEDNVYKLLNNNSINPNVKVSTENLCYCIYTSGSTGMPKGTLVKQKGIVNLATYIHIYKGLLKCDRFGFMTTITFDVASQEIFTALLNGFEGVLFLERKEKGLDHVLSDIIDFKIAVMYATPTYFKALTNSKEKTRRLLSTLKIICLAGENFEVNENVIMLSSPNLIMQNHYGPAETHVVSSTIIENYKDIHIGKPIANTQIYIVDRYLNPLPIGVTGELCIAGDGVGAGYLNRPDLTAKKFINNPFGEGKLYKTGDLAYWREDGNIVYVGRNDFQVKIRGLRIELGEIENAICSIDIISQSVVVVRKNDEGRQFICAFYTGTETDAKEIRNYIGKKLPKYMLPHLFIHLEKIPMTSSGKINRKALPEVDLYAVDTLVEYIAPSTEKEKILVSAIQNILGIEKVGVMDNFFDIGGDSLKAIELISQIEKQGYHTDTKKIFDCENIKELAEQLSIVKCIEEKYDYSGDIPATNAQMRVYTAQSMQSDSTTYNVPYAFKTKEKIDIERLQTAVNKLIERHEILRTCFENKEGKIIQIIHDAVECKIEKLRTDDIASFIRPFELSNVPLFRVGVYKNIVMLDMHHIITDGSSMPIFFNELNELYMGRNVGNAPVQYKQYAIQKQDYSKSEKYWLSVYSDEIPVLEINTDFNREQKQSFKGKAIYNIVDIELHSNILNICREQNITPYVFYMSGFNILLSKFSGNEDIVVGMPISGRDTKYLDTIGMFVNTMALRSKPEGTKTVAEFLHEVKNNSVEAINYQDYPYGKLVKKLDIQTNDRNPLFNVMFAYQSEQMTDVVFGDKQVELLPIPITTSKYDFTFNVMPRENDVVIMTEYCSELYKEETMQRLVEGYKQILGQMLDSNLMLKEISAITEQEQQKLLYAFNDTAVGYPRDKCVHELFEQQVERMPDKIAAIASDKTLTYEELNKQANSIAHSLVEKEIGVGDIVAIKLARKSYLFSAMLGVVKSGAAYMPIDPEYPQDRISYMITESKAKYCIDDDSVLHLLSHKNDKNLNITIDCNYIFCALHTSGSTGMPKMSLLKHGSISSFIVANRAFWKDIDTVVSATIVTFDAFIMDSVLSVAQGKQVILASEHEIYNQVEFENLFNHSKYNMFFSTPTKIESYIDNSQNKHYLSKIKNFVIGGEVFKEQLLNKIKEFSPDSNVYNIYGPTETTICAVVDELKLGEDITIGKPISNAQIYIVDKYMKLVPIGVNGELCIAGDGVGAGYLNHPELTAEKFIDNPFGEGKLYKTGDLAYWREDGNIVYVGRNDFQVKIRGLRIELEEIENAISSIKGISQAVVVVRKNNEGRQLICAFYTGVKFNAKDIRNQIGKKLPKYMLPHIFTHIEEMPMTTSGKINRKVLPEVSLENIAEDSEYVAPETQLQKELCKLMGVVLDTTQVGISDDFFDLGGDSLKAIELVSKAHNEGIYFNLQNVFDYPTVKELCECIENGDKQVISYADVDFTAINNILEKNKSEYIAVPQKNEVGNILLAGATGYLGIHILADYLDNDTGIAYCLVRGKNKKDSTKRLKELLNFYFGGRYTNMHQIEVICADLQKDNFGLSEDKYKELLSNIDTVINCAASVKHYGSYKYFYEVNVETTKRLIEFCKVADAKLIHTSTLSVSGNTFGDTFDGYVSENEKHFYESSLYIDQPLDNVYGRSKFEAEKAVLDAMVDGLKANIMRMGNLTNRRDGMFQKNHESNAFLKRVKSVLEMGIFPDYLMDIYAEFTPIDEAANAVMTIARNFSTEQTVFHINSNKVVYFDRLLKMFNELGFELKTVTGAEFTEVLRQTAKQVGMEHIFETFINDMDENDQLNYDSNIRIENDFTVKYLKLLGFEWSDIDIDYLRKYVEYFRKIGYLE